MELLILKSVGCLAVFIVFYKLCLENLAIHKFKRFYLLGALLLSIIIPFITFIRYVEPSYDFGNFEEFGVTVPYFPADVVVEEEVTNLSIFLSYLPTILWSIYGLGVFIFGTKFCINLFNIVSKVNKNEKQKQPNFITVLLKDYVVPHTFFSYIFLNKTKFEAKAIPQEVLLHEQAHAKQKHSFDIIFVELLQVAFWFNPLLYFIKKDIKLNHEFLADKAVLNKGVSPIVYKKLLLAFSSNASHPEMANAINYSLIKKRFTIMKTQTSKKAIWLRSLLLLPLLAILLFSFSSTKEVEKEMVPAMLMPQETQENSTEAIDDIKEAIDKAGADKVNYSSQNNLLLENKKDLIIMIQVNSVMINGKNSSIETFKEDLNTVTKEWEETDYTSVKATILIASTSKDYLKQLEKEFNKTHYAKANEDISLSNQKSRVYNDVNTKETKLLVNGIECNKCTLSLSKKEVNNLVLSTNNEDVISFNFKIPGQPTQRVNGNTLNKKSKQSLLVNAEKGDLIQFFYIKTKTQKLSSHLSINIVNDSDKNYPKAPKTLKVKRTKMSNIPEPPKPPKLVSREKHIKDMASKGATFYFDGNKITKEKALELVKNNTNMNISSTSNNGESTVHLSKKPIKTKNGKLVKEKNKVEWKQDAKKNPKPMAEEFKGMEINGGQFFYEGKKISEAKAIALVKQDPKLNVSIHATNGKKTAHISKKGNKTYKGKLIRQGMFVDTADLSKSGFNFKLSDSSTVVLEGTPSHAFNSKPIADNEKQLAYRKRIVHVAEKSKEKFNYNIKGKLVSINEVHKFITKYPNASVKIANNSNGIQTLSFNNSEGEKMKISELQSVYSKVFNL